MPQAPGKRLLAPRAAALVGALLLVAAPMRAFMIDVPPEVRTKPQEEQRRWVRSYMEENYTLQLQVARERHDQRMGAADQLVQKMAGQAYERRKIIEQMREESSREMKAMASSADTGLYGTVGLGALVLALWWFFYGRPVVVQRRAGAHAARQSSGKGQEPRVYVLRTRRQPADGTTPKPAQPPPPPGRQATPLPAKSAREGTRSPRALNAPARLRRLPLSSRDSSPPLSPIADTQRMGASSPCPISSWWAA